MRLRCGVAFLVLSCALAGEASPPKGGAFARQATDAWRWVGGGVGKTTVYAPDRRSRVTVRGVTRGDNETVEVEVDGALGHLRTNIGAGVGSEVLWSPDSKRFFLTASEGGGAGPYEVLVFGIFDGRLQSRDLNDLIVRRFGSPVKCYEPSAPNVAGVGWRDSGQILVAAQVYPDTNCDSMGTFRLYQVDVDSMNILQEFGQIEAKRKFWPMLGTELREASDDCVRHPKRCWVAANHTRSKSD